MSRGVSKATRLLVDVITTTLNHGAGDLTPLLDDLQVEYRRAAGGTLKEARAILTTRLDAALRVLEDDAWVAVKVTAHYVDHYKGQHPNHPDTDAEIVRCVAGVGTGLPTHAIHFCAEAGDCLLFLEASIHGFKSGEGANGGTVRRMRVKAEGGQLTPGGVAAIVEHADIRTHKDVGKVYRLAGKANQRLLPTKKTA